MFSYVELREIGVLCLIGAIFVLVILEIMK